MRRAKTELFVHLVWATWDRVAVITEALEERLYGCLQAEAAAMGAAVRAIGGTADHVHLLVELPATVAVADLVKQVKGASSHLATHDAGESCFKWQGAYGAFTVSPHDLDRVERYIRNQAAHHATTADEAPWS